MRTISCHTYYWFTARCICECEREILVNFFLKSWFELYIYWIYSIFNEAVSVHVNSTTEYGPYNVYVYLVYRIYESTIPI